MTKNKARAAVATLAALTGPTMLVLMSAPAQAGPPPSTVTISSNLFPNGDAVPGGMSGTISVRLGSSNTLTAPEYIYQPPVAPSTTPTAYEFMFWDVGSSLFTTETATFRDRGYAASFAATAWYLPICVAGTGCSGGGPSAVTTWAFSLTNYKVLPGTPIESVDPASAWTSPSTSVSTATDVDISAQPFWGPHSRFYGTVFNSWFVFGGASTVTSGVDLKVPAGESPYAIAFYNQYTSPIPPPCIGYPHCI